MSSSENFQKVLLMGLGASGKSSIKSIVFEGKSLESVKDYSATINYSRSTKNIIDSAFQIIDCGGQELFLSSFIGDQAEFIFNGVSILIWVVDLSNFDQVSTGKFYFDHAVNRLLEYSPNAVVFCFLHKSDMIIDKMHDEIYENMKTYFTPPEIIKVHYVLTSIYDHSIFLAVGDMIRTLIVKDSTANSMSETIQAFAKKNNEIMGITLFNKDGLPLFTQGTMVNQAFQPSDLISSNHVRTLNEFTRSSAFKISLETDLHFYIFHKVNSDLILSLITQKTLPLQFVLLKTSEIADVINKLV
ncbi:MAG: ADP-ribosylation factor-like protein [Candidatus Hodarchaeales archaeon]